MTKFEWQQGFMSEPSIPFDGTVAKSWFKYPPKTGKTTGLFLAASHWAHTNTWVRNTLIVCADFPLFWNTQTLMRKPITRSVFNAYNLRVPQPEWMENGTEDVGTCAAIAPILVAEASIYRDAKFLASLKNTPINMILVDDAHLLPAEFCHYIHQASQSRFSRHIIYMLEDGK